ncbi:hypothetical protein CN533_05010 [Priestia megaterium]|uniref:zinc-ribbon domain-containing protein n=1 Tax=Priestia megaterium TaxID=1404 RepID=UPI000BF3B8BD|nr:zinc-ribbon domain-containing protein [Priestia megaterium]PET72766.1 hypothetical protein CN533_05010 [Priestia megaterium]PFK88886.1 hypothetical protein COJ19_04300 [Priestia megaterium]
MKEKKKRYLLEYPQLMKEWHATKNYALDPLTMTYGSSKWVWWQCDKGHEWRVQIYNRTNEKKPTGCPYCTGRLPSKENCLESLFPEISKEWHPSMNQKLLPRDVAPKSGKKAWWRCNKGHAYHMVIADRTSQGSGCPYCLGKKVDKTNNLYITHPHIAKEWHPNKNGDLTAKDVTKGKRLKVWWQGKCGHEWDAYIYSRTGSDSGCPYCSGRLTERKYSIAYMNPTLAKQWHPIKNNGITPEEVLPGSGKSIWWMCEQGHEWEAVVSSRKKSGCPYCSGLYASEEKNLETTRPYISKFWHPTKNGMLAPKNVTPYSGKKVWWKCLNGHEWQSKISQRTTANCPTCNREFKTSYAEQFLLYFLKKAFPKTENRYKHPILSKRQEIDVFIPEINLAIEYDGFYSHHNYEERDKKKNQILWENHISFIRVREKRLRELLDYGAINIFHNPGNEDSIKECLFFIFDWIIKNKEVSRDESKAIEELRLQNFREEYYNISASYMEEKQDYNLACIYPELASEWHPTKNGNLIPEKVFPNGKSKVWWICRKGHEWKQEIHIRSGRRVGCPFCSNKRVNEENSLFTTHPNLVSSWHPLKNGELTPYHVTAGSKKMAWWICEHGHEWKSVIHTRKSSGCPYCVGKKVTKENSLGSVHPEVAKEWHPTKNENLTPFKVPKAYAGKVWWKCGKGHEWKATVNHRTNAKNPTGCPYCSGRRAFDGNCLELNHPYLAKLWHPHKNENLTPKQVTVSSGKKVWWQCMNGHQYERRVVDQVKYKGSCKLCKRLAKLQ